LWKEISSDRCRYETEKARSRISSSGFSTGVSGIPGSSRDGHGYALTFSAIRPIGGAQFEAAHYHQIHRVRMRKTLPAVGFHDRTVAQPGGSADGRDTRQAGHQKVAARMT
jgi:hypothetical protein